MSSFNPSGHIRSTSESNFQGRIRAVVFGEDNRVINPGDMILEMEDLRKGDRQGKNVTRLEIYVAGRDMGGLLDQVTRAHELFKQNAEWLLQPSSRQLTPQEIEDRKPIIHEPRVKAPVDQERLAEHLEFMKTFKPSLG